MKKRFFLFALAALLVATSCDKIENNNYLIFSGATGTWYDGEGVADHSHRVYLEKYTGVKCNNCPKADTIIHIALEKYGDKLVALSIHDSSSFGRPYEGQEDLRTDDGNAWSVFFGMLTSNKPAAIINRTSNNGSWVVVDPKTSMDDYIDACINEAPVLALAVNSTMGDDAMSIDVNLEFLQNYNDDLTLTLLLMEDGIVASQLFKSVNENYVHNHILRDVITDIWGADIDADGKAGTKRHVVFSYNQMKPNWNLSNCHVVAFVSDKQSKKVLNVASCPIN